ncbi:uncharacterized protein LOC110465481 [Mizuhopecten yessoensis]|uniref:XK-related protein n=1 Tax=Mizuhopecten yessoensis TaxID=6573 RepID=A0A210PRL6_MIZYE|nr:uncharacterized protein LOC110465481 [Mizuhopecten yessoensis]OWF39092.1 XK-related protein 5 [Mizuhopecten yessoensis]
MGCLCLPVCFSIYIIISLLLHIGEVVLNIFFVVYLFPSLETWFTVVLGLMMLPMVLVQLVSALLLLQKRGEHLTCWQALSTAVIHILQLGFVWRHIRILRESEALWKKRDLADLLLLRLFYAFSASLPILGIQAYFIIFKGAEDKIIISAAVVTLFSTCWALSCFRRRSETDDIENLALSCPGTIFRLLWRSGELVSRVLSLAVFASVYHYWVFVVTALHWLTMLVCICTSFLGVLEVNKVNRCYRFFLCMLISYIYLFCHVNFSSDSAQFRYVTYYVIMFFENGVLTAVWYLSVQGLGDMFKVYTLLFIICSAFFISVVSMLVYYKIFHIPGSDMSKKNHSNLCVQDGCINCKLSLCVKHSKMLQRPFSAGWISQYQEALINGDYYKNLLQDSFIDSENESKSSSAVSCSGKEEQEENKEDDVSPFTRKTLSFQSNGTYSHRRFIRTDAQSLAAPKDHYDSESMLSYIAPTVPTGSSASGDSSDGSVTSTPLPRFIGSPANSQTRLLTDSWDNLPQDNLGFDPCSNKMLPGFRPIPHQNLEDWYSDGYSTDHTESVYQLPITVLAKMKSSRSKCRDRTSLASDSTECTMCRNMKSYKLLRKYSRASSEMSKEDVIQEEKEDDRDKKLAVSDPVCVYSYRKDIKSIIRDPRRMTDPVYVDSPRGQAWYNCSESGDSAFPQEYLSSSNFETTFDEEEDGISESSYELII